MGQIRMYELVTGIEASAQPDAGDPVLPNDLVTLSYLEAYSERVKKVGTYAAPILVVAGTAIDPTIEVSKDAYLVFVAGNGGPVDMSADPQIVAPGRAGITLQIVGTSDANTVKLDNGAGLNQNGPRTLKSKTSISYISIDANTWQEVSRD